MLVYHNLEKDRRPKLTQTWSPRQSGRTSWLQRRTLQRGTGSREDRTQRSTLVTETGQTSALCGDLGATVRWLLGMLMGVWSHK